MSKKEKIDHFNPNGMASGNQLFGLPFSEEESDIVILPVPWEVTVSYRTGTAKAPLAILEASKQVDLYDPDLQDAWKQGIFLRIVNKQMMKWGKDLRAKAKNYLSYLEEGLEPEEEKFLRKMRDQINIGSIGLNDWVREEMRSVLLKHKMPGLLGGDHSTPLGLMEALAEVYPEYGILQIDAHCDLRKAYEGFEFSHASIMYNALKIKEITKLVQVGIRDYCQEEIDVIRASNGRVKTYFDADLKRDIYEGTSWQTLCDSMVNQLPPLVYISFDIDGLDPKLCPNTGTPVAGGLEFEQAVYLILKVVRSGRKIIGFDLNEVAPGTTEWDANVAARMLYKLCNLMGLSKKMYQDSSYNQLNEAVNKEAERIKRKNVEEDEDLETAD